MPEAHLRLSFQSLSLKAAISACVENTTSSEIERTDFHP
jgi:hypothetical protein